MAFPLMALGAGLGQFAEQMQQQRAQQERSLMLQMQLANYQREMDKDRREASAADILARFDPSAALTGPGGAGGFGALKPQTGPQGGSSALTGPIPGMGGAPGGMPPPMKPDMGAGEYGAGTALSPYAQGNAAPGGASSVEGLWPEFSQRIQVMTQAMPPEIRNKFGIISGYRSPERQAQVNPGVTNSHHTGGGQGAGLAVDTTRDPDVLAWINANGRQFGVGYTLQGMPGEDNHLEMLGPDSRRIPANQMAQFGGGQTTPQQAAGVASGLASSTDMQGPPQPPIPPPSRATIAQMVRADERFKNADYRAVGVAVTNMEKSLQETYRNKQAEYQNQLKIYHDYGPGRQQRRQEELQDAPAKAKATAEATAGIPTRAPQTHKEVTLEGGATVTGIPGRPETWTTMTGKPLTPDQLKMLDEGRIQKFGSASSQVDPVTVKAMAKGIAEYKLAPVTSWAQRTPFGQAVLTELTTSYPDYDQAKYKQREQGLIAFTKGRQGDSVRSISVALDHLGTMEEAAQALETGDVQLLNRVEQWAKQQFGYEAPVDFDFVKNVVGSEVSKAVIGGIGGVTDREEMRAAFQRANSPEQLAGVIKQAKKLMAAQLDGYRRQSESSGFPTKDFDAALSPRARQELDALARPGATPAGSPAAPSQQQNATPPQGARLPLPPEFASKPDGTGWRNKQTGKMWVKQGNEMIETPGAVETPQ